MRYPIIKAVLLLVLVLPARAADGDGGCKKFAWPLTRERAWFTSSDKPSIAAGDHLASVPKGAFVVRLQPATQASFATPPVRNPKSEGWFGGAIWFPALQQAGIYQITLSDDAWIDIVQDGRFARPIGSSGRRDCPGLRKSVRLELLQGPFVLQLSGTASDAIAVAIRFVRLP
jgi:hypothetical protein